MGHDRSGSWIILVDVYSPSGKDNWQGTDYMARCKGKVLEVRVGSSEIASDLKETNLGRFLLANHFAGGGLFVRTFCDLDAGVGSFAEQLSKRES